MGSGDERDQDEPPLFSFEDVWPEKRPFPMTDAECTRLVRGHLVRWRGTLEEMLELPGVYEMVASAGCGSSTCLRTGRTTVAGW